MVASTPLVSAAAVLAMDIRTSCGRWVREGGKRDTPGEAIASEVMMRPAACKCDAAARDKHNDLAASRRASRGSPPGDAQTAHRGPNRNDRPSCLLFAF